MPRIKDPNAGVNRHMFAFPDEILGFDMPRFDSMLEGQGVDIEVFSATICPLDSVSPDDGRHEGHSQCSNGFLYKCEGRVKALFVNNAGDPKFDAYGIERDAVAYLTVPRFYDTLGADGNPKPVIIGHYYRIYLADCQTPVMNSEKIAHSVTGLDRLSYPALEVFRIVDARGNEYNCPGDFEIEAGDIRWAAGRASPGYDAVLGRGEVFSVLYSYKPFFYVRHIPHEIRVTRVVNEMTGDEVLVRAPYQLVLEREWAHHNQNRAPEQKAGQRSFKQPASGSFGSR